MLAYAHRQPAKDAPLVEAIGRVAQEHPTWGYRLVAAWLINQGWPVSRNRIRRLWQREGYAAQWRRKRRKIRRGERLKPAPEAANSVWCMDFAEDRLENGRRFQTLLLKDEASAYCMGLPIQPSFKAIDVERELDALVDRYGAPQFVRCDNGGQFIAFTVQRWAEQRGVQMAHIDPGKPWQNGAAESLVAPYRREVLDAELFHSITEAQVISERWRRMYNQERPHSRLAYQPPATAYPQAVDRAA